MRIICSEFRKLFSNRLFIICLTLFFIVNSVGLYFLTSSDENYKYEISLSDDYKKELSYYLNMEKDEALSDFAELKEAYKIASSIQSAANKDVDSQYSEYITGLIEQYKSESPKAFEKAQQIIIDGFSPDDLYIIERLTEKFSYIGNYSAFIDEMKARSDSQLQFSIFSKPGTFAYNNIAKTPADFEHLKGIEITPGFDLGLNLSTSFELTDYLALILVLLICITLFSAEREKGLTVLVKSTKNGRTQTYMSKLAVILLTVSCISVVYYISDLAVGGLAYGLGDLNRSIQSIPEFMNCSHKCTVLQYLILWVAKKTLTLFAVALITAFLFTLIKSANITYIVLALFFGAEFCLYNFTDAMSPVNHLKFINIFYYLDGNELFGSYLNLDFFSQPINAASVYLIFLLFCVVAIPVAGSLVFSRRGQFAGKPVFSGIFEKIRKKVHIFAGSSSVFGGECYKHYISSKAILVILVLAVFCWGSFTENIDIVYTDVENAAYAAYMNKLGGELTPEKEKFLEDEQKYFEKLNNELAETEADTSLSEEEKSTRTTAINNIIDARGRGFERMMSQYETIKSVGEKLGITPYFINSKTGRRLMADSSREWNSFAMLLLIIIFTLSTIFAYEHKREMRGLVCATKKGKGRLVGAKFITAILTYSVVYALVYLPYLINYIRTFGTDIFSMPLVFLEGFESLQSDITIMQSILLEGFLHISASLAAVMLILFLSDKLKNAVSAMIVSTAITIIPCVLVYFNSAIRVYSLFMNDKLGVMLILTAVSVILAILFAGLTCMSFTGIELRRHKNGA